MVPQATLSPKAQAWMKALGRATAERIVVYRVSPLTLGVATVADGWAEKPYTIAITGERACDVSCDCPGARNGRTCKHLAAAVFARKHHVYARRPLLPSTPAEVAYTRQLMAQTTASLIAGVAPSLAEMFA